MLLSLPAALGPVRLNDSFWIDWVWLEQFAYELGKGIVYPRWLPRSHGGLGSPVFYYYPPLAFYAGSACVFLGLSTFRAVVATFAAASLLSGAGDYLWLKDQTRRSAALVGALIYMIALYQLFDFYSARSNRRVRRQCCDVFRSVGDPGNDAWPCMSLTQAFVIDT